MTPMYFIEKEPYLSDVARLRQQIADEVRAMHWLMNGPAIVGRHDFINQRERNMQAFYQQHKELVGEQEAITFLYQVHSQMDSNDTTTTEKPINH